MIVGIGTDIVELTRIESILERIPRFIEKILTASEKEKALKLNGKRRVEFVAGRFAAKEAFSKAWGTGIGEQLSFQDIEVTSDDKGKPYIKKHPMWRQKNVHVSISHSELYAVANVVIEEK
ncbi:holo-ACP synthase [Priestia filamentosa]|uniref:holo-ACP synthase n=1 Tax=Priestia filamentosa TaxID=1402861 RepID=UPI000588F572